MCNVKRGVKHQIHKRDTKLVLKINKNKPKKFIKKVQKKGKSFYFVFHEKQNGKWGEEKEEE